MPVVPLTADPVPMTDEQRFVFDLKGWLLLPGVLEPDLIEAIREDLRKPTPQNAHDRRRTLSGAAQELVDHPAIVGILREIIAPDPSPDSYGFRCESSFVMGRAYGQRGPKPPHVGPLVGPLAYRVLNGTIWSGLTRVVWELSPVRQREGGTPVMSGSHKSNFAVPPSCQQYDPFLYEGYTCPAGSALIFSESCWHYGVEWKDAVDPRLAIFNCYNSYVSQWHKMNVDADLVASMPAKRRTAFRGVWAHDVRAERYNHYYASDNAAL
jgi:hypothetical protein